MASLKDYGDQLFDQPEEIAIMISISVFLLVTNSIALFFAIKNCKFLQLRNKSYCL